MENKRAPDLYECVRCGHFWMARKPTEPKRCAKCKSPYWQGNLDPRNEDIVRGKWAMDGATTLTEAAKMLTDYAARLKKLERGGWQLTDEIQEDYGTIERTKK